MKIETFELTALRKVNRSLNMIRRRLSRTNVTRVNFEPVVRELIALMTKSFREAYGGSNRDLELFETAVRQEVDQLTPDFRNLYRQARAQGMTPRQARQLLLKRLDATKARIASLYRTYSQQAHLSGIWHLAQDDDKVWGFRYLTKGDDRVRFSHDRLHEVTLPKDHRFWKLYFPPNGFGCRCGIQVLRRRTKLILPPRRVTGIDPQFKVNIGRIFSS